MALLDTAFLQVLLTEIDFTQSGIRQLLMIADKILEDTQLSSLYERFYKDEILTGNWRGIWHIDNPPDILKEAFGEQYTLFYLLCYLERLPECKHKYKNLNIPESIYKATLSDISVWLENWNDRYGYYCFMNLGWIWRHLDAELFRVGRLQYQLASYNGDFLAFRNRASGVTAVFGSNEIAVNPSGDMVGAGRENDQTSFTAKPAEISGKTITGNAVTPYGKVVERPVRLNLSEWEQVLAKGDKVLEIHIPRSGEFTPDSVRESYGQALALYEKNLAVTDIKGLSCHTWMFTPQLQEMLNPESNLVKFQREFYLLPNAGSFKFMWNFVFHEKIARENAPRDTSLRRKMLTYLEEGKPLFDLKGILLHKPEEWGSQPYMRSYDTGEWMKQVGNYE